ncbi:MAG TPA: glycosyltransferase [Candidatus Baltobacteraceae bacterium]|nr:glycosyltransferase [Candidatus Baltobacteraceae bacterium]
MRISVIIATKDRASYLARALASLEGQIAAPSFEAIVVDNGSSDDTKAVTQQQAERGKYPVRYLFEAEPNRGKARNRGLAVAQGYLVLFVDDDVQLPPGFLAAHETAHSTGNLVVNGPIINVSSYEARPRPVLGNYSGAFLCTCNVSVPKHAIEAVGGFDEAFHLYGWEDTELGVRLREAGLRRRFAWEAYLWHIKVPGDNTLEVETRKVMERARMARRFLEKQPTPRARMATGAHPVNLLRARYLLPDSLLAVFAGMATSPNVPAFVRSLARVQFLDGMYARELVRVLDEAAPS